MPLKRLVFALPGCLSAMALALSACGTAVPALNQVIPATPLSADAQVAPRAQPAAATPRPSNYLPDLASAAQAEGQLTVIGLPHSWCNYGGAIQDFESRYGIQVNELDPNASPSAELQAVAASKDGSDRQAPDVIDVVQSFGQQAAQQGLLQPYQVSTWNDIPEAARDPNGYWYGDYYGVMSFEVNTDVVGSVPQDWLDLLDPKYKGQVALSGDPQTASPALDAVFAAGLSADGGDLANAAKAGLDFFDKLNKEGNFIPVFGNAETVASGQTPITLTWDYQSLTDADILAGNPHIRTVVPRTGVVAGIHVQAISAYAPHPNAAKLWEEYLYSDAGQLQWLKGYCHPIRFNALFKANKIPASLQGKLPPASSYAAVLFPSLDAQTAYRNQISREWPFIVGTGVK